MKNSDFDNLKDFFNRVAQDFERGRDLQLTQICDNDDIEAYFNPSQAQSTQSLKLTSSPLATHRRYIMIQHDRTTLHETLPAAPVYENM